MSIIDSLNKLRDAHIQFTLSHQSMSDLELVSKEFAQAVWDNTRTKDLLAQDNPELCERMARSLCQPGRRGIPTSPEQTHIAGLARAGLPVPLGQVE